MTITVLVLLYAAVHIPGNEHALAACCPANTQIQAAFIQDNKDSTINGICHHVGQKENQTRIYPLHIGQTKTRNINTFANNVGC